MLSKVQQKEFDKVEAWEKNANSNTLLSFSHMSENIAKQQKVSIERAKILAYRKMKKKGMII